MMAIQPVSTVLKAASQLCFHCGANCDEDALREAEKAFCCEGCYTVYSLLQDHGMQGFYRLNPQAGTKSAGRKEVYQVLEEAAVQEKLLDFQSEKLNRVTFTVPTMHCSSCIWLLEKLYKFQPGIKESRVDFPRKQVFIGYDPRALSLREVAELLQQLGYPPALSLNELDKKDKQPTVNRRLLTQLGVAGFCFGNIMLFSFPEYLGLEGAVFAHLFGGLNFVLSLPVMLYAAQDYFKSAWAGWKQRRIHMDVPIVMGITAIFLRSSADLFMQTGPGYFDALAGLVFFLLLGKVFQDKTYSFLSFERDYRSYFPISTERVQGKEVKNVPVSGLKKGDQIRVHAGELIPADGLLLSGSALIDYSFVTGESDSIPVEEGEKLFAGGRQRGGTIELVLTEKVERSYLTRLWNHSAFTAGSENKQERLSDRVSGIFTAVILSVAVLSGVFWFFYDDALALQVFAAVLIVACPCALALATPFTLGHTLRLLGRNHLYLKGAEVVESLAGIDTVVFDKTGTLTEAGKSSVSWVGDELNRSDRGALAALSACSLHPLSRSISAFLGQGSEEEVTFFQETAGAGWEGTVDGRNFRAGTAAFTGNEHPGPETGGSRVYVSIDGKPKGYFALAHMLRAEVKEVLQGLDHAYDLYLISGDNEADRETFSQLLPGKGKLHFRQQPADKLHFIAALQQKGKRVLMLGDGLNDAGALKQADVGISLTEDIAAFTPASDGILGAAAFAQLPTLIQFAQTAKKIILASFALSVLYNLIGLAFAVTGQLSPLVAAVLMPLSSISVVGFTTFWVSFLGKRKGL